MEQLKATVEQLVREEANKALPSSHYVAQKFMEEFHKNLQTGLDVIMGSNKEATSETSNSEKEEQAYNLAILRAVNARRKYVFSLDSILEKEFETMETLQADASLYKRKQPKAKETDKDFDSFVQAVGESATDLSSAVVRLQELKEISSKVSIATDIYERLAKELEDEE